jgi:nucleotide-binding universal stress UspA family protein
MKTILISTDFSANAAHAAAYGYNLAKQTKANVLLANAVIVPAEMPQSGMIVWPLMEDDVLKDESVSELQKLKAHLEQNDYSDTFRPAVNYVSEDGMVADVVQEAAGKEIGLIVIGKHANGGIRGFLLGNHCNTLIDTTPKPLLIIPPDAAIKPIKKIAYATDLKKIKKDMAALYELIEIVRHLSADILLTHIYTETNHPRELQLMIDQLMTELSNKANYPHIYYRAIKESKPEDGLNWLCENGHIDILAMNHGPHNFIDDVLNLSHTKKMAAHATVPLLVFPATV